MKRVLIVTANPRNTHTLSLDSEANSIQESLQLPLQRNQFEVRLRTGATRLFLQRDLLEYRPHILHFALHGVAEGIILEDDDNSADIFTSEALSDLFRQLRGDIQCVVLNSCYSRQQIEAISTYVPYVIGMNGAIQDRLAIRFSRSFYYALACGLSYRQSFELGRNAVFDLEEPMLVTGSNGSGDREPSQSDKQRRVSPVLERGSTERIDVIADAALYVSGLKHDYKEVLRKEIIDDKQFCSTKYLYSTNEGFRRWLEACDLNKNKAFVYYKNAVDLLEIQAESIIDKALSESSRQSADFDFISLGCGDGRKDKAILEAMCERISEDQKIYYYPIDISTPMIIEAIRNVKGNSDDSKDNEFRRKILIKAIVGDFTALNSLKFIYEERPNNNFFSILGNTLGNSSEQEILDSLCNAMFPDDFLLIEINIDQDSSKLGVEKNFYKTEQNQRRQFLPLEILGVMFEARNVRYESKPGDSIIDPVNTQTLKTFYENAVIGGRKIDFSIKLAKIHHYDFYTFPTEINKRLDTRTIHAWKGEDVGLFLLQKNKPDESSIR